MYISGDSSRRDESIGAIFIQMRRMWRHLYAENQRLKIERLISPR